MIKDALANIAYHVPEVHFGGASACASMNKDGQSLTKGRPDLCYSHQNELRYSGMREGRSGYRISPAAPLSRLWHAFLELILEELDLLKSNRHLPRKDHTEATGIRQ